MQTFFKKYFWTARLAFVVVAALLLAGAINGFAASKVATYSVTYPEGEGNLLPRDSDTVEIAPIHPTSFGSPEPEPEPENLCADVTCEEDQECDPSTGECVDVVEEAAAAPSDGRCIESDIAINLVGTMVSADDDWSVAILHNPSVNQTQFANIGTNLLAEGEVTRIERNRIFLMRNGREECLRHGTQQERAARAQEAQQSAAAAAPAPSAGTPQRPSARPSVTNRVVADPEPTPSRSTNVLDRIRTEVTQGDDGSYNVPRDLIEEVANNQALLEQQAPQIRPNYQGGQPHGFRLTAVPSGSIFNAIGVRNGDVIVAINGTTLDSPQRALEQYQSMLQQGSVSMEIERRGRSQTLSYNIR